MGRQEGELRTILDADRGARIEWGVSKLNIGGL